MPDTPAIYDYEFTIWPEAHEREHSVFEVFRHITPRISLTMTQGEFWEFLSELRASGLTALEVTKGRHRDAVTGHVRASHRAA